MKMTIPYNVFILLWCLIGLGLVGTDLVMKFLNNKDFEWLGGNMLHFVWFFVFALYVVAYFKHRMQEKTPSQSK